MSEDKTYELLEYSELFEEHKDHKIGIYTQCQRCKNVKCFYTMKCMNEIAKKRMEGHIILERTPVPKVYCIDCEIWGEEKTVLQSKNMIEEEKQFNVYTERTILLNFVISQSEVSHFYIDDAEEEGYKTVVCIHLGSNEGSFTWHISDSDLKYLPELSYFSCEFEFYDTENKYHHLREYLADRHDYKEEEA